MSIVANLEAQLTRAGYSFHQGTAADGPELDGRHWWCLSREGWSGVDAQPDTSDTHYGAMQSALAHMVDEVIAPTQEPERDPYDAPTVSLWYVEHVPGDLGAWDRAWFLTKDEASADYEAKIASGEYNRENDCCGEAGDIMEPQSVEVELTPAGVLWFAREHAVEQA